MWWLLLLTTRQSINELSVEQQTRFVDGMVNLKNSGTYDQMTTLHAQKSLFGQVHFSDFFLPWHRWFLLQFEQNIQSILNDSSFSLPYWDWTHDPELPSFLGPLKGDCIIDPAWMANWTSSEGRCIKRIDNVSHSLPSAQDVEPLFGLSSFSLFSRNLQFGPHLAIHSRIGGNMAGRASPDDPLFWLHHAYVDKIWYTRQLWEGIDNATLRLAMLPGTDNVTVDSVWDPDVLPYTYDYL